MNRLILVIACMAILGSPAHAQTSCPGTDYLGWGQAVYPNTTTLNVSFAGGAGSATCNGPFDLDADAVFQTCDESTWNSAGPHYGIVYYAVGKDHYFGAAQFWLDFKPASTPYCTENGKAFTHMIARLRIQSCSSSHVLNNHFLAVSCDGNYCESVTNVPCDTNYAAENYVNLTITLP